MPGQEFKIKSDNPWDSLMIPDGQTLAVGTRIYNGARLMLVNGVETEIADQVWNGDYPLDNGKIIAVVDGVISEINDSPTEAPLPGATKAAAQAKRDKYIKR